MSQTTSTASPAGVGASATTASTQPATTAEPGGALDKNAFLKLMMVQLQHQNPLDPSDPTQYISELAQFSALEQQTNIATASATTAQEQNAAASLSLLGHTVTYTDADGNDQSGQVQKVNFTSSGPSLTIAGVGGISPGAITEVS